VRGGSLPLLVWGTLVLAALVGNWIWTDDWIQVATFGVAVLIIYGCAAVLAVRSRRESLRRGPPLPSTRAEALARFSPGAFLLALGFASLMFGFVFGRFFVYFGGGLMVVGAGLIAIERRGERRMGRRWTGGAGR
jgi:hypothetical protein